MWGNPLVTTKPPKTPKPKPPLDTFKVIKPTLPKSEAKKILLHSGDLSMAQVQWAQRWLEQRIRERSLPPQFAKADAFGQIATFLSPPNALSLLNEIRADFQKTLPLEEKPTEESFLAYLASEAYHEHLPPPHTSSRNSRLLDDGHESD
jgi:hypothetical protein